jgi:hypothetical protein
VSDHGSVASLRSQAEKCLRLAISISDSAARGHLEALAVEYTAAADALEAEQNLMPPPEAI